VLRVETNYESGTWSLYEIRRDARNAVLYEQDNQRKAPSHMDEVTLEFSNCCANAAFARDKLDRKDILLSYRVVQYELAHSPDVMYHCIVV